MRPALDVGATVTGPEKGEDIGLEAQAETARIINNKFINTIRLFFTLFPPCITYAPQVALPDTISKKANGLTDRP